MKPTENVESTNKKDCKSRESEWDHLEGDALVIRMKENKSKLWISGNGCQVSLGRNFGSIRVTGDGCQVHVGINTGSVEYDGDGGQVVLGPDSTNTKVKYRGDGGSVSCTDSLKNLSDKRCPTDHQEEKKATEKKKNTKARTTRTVVSNGKTIVTRRNLDDKGRILSTKIVTSNCCSDPNGNSVVEMKTEVQMGLLGGINVSVTNCV